MTIACQNILHIASELTSRELPGSYVQAGWMMLRIMWMIDRGERVYPGARDWPRGEILCCRTWLAEGSDCGVRAEQDGKLQPPGRNQFIGLGKFVTDDTAQGIVQGEADKQREIAAAMLAKGLDHELILDITGLTAEQLSEIKKDLAAIKQG